jgi:hypothetical protein
MKAANFERMNKTTIEEIDNYNASCGLVAIISNGNLLAILDEGLVEAFDKERTEHGL